MDKYSIQITADTDKTYGITLGVDYIGMMGMGLGAPMQNSGGGDSAVWTIASL